MFTGTIGRWSRMREGPYETGDLLVRWVGVKKDKLREYYLVLGTNEDSSMCQGHTYTLYNLLNVAKNENLWWHETYVHTVMRKAA
jgi:hypothetical protein